MTSCEGESSGARSQSNPSVGKQWGPGHEFYPFLSAHSMYPFSRITRHFRIIELCERLEGIPAFKELLRETQDYTYKLMDDHLLEQYNEGWSSGGDNWEDYSDTRSPSGPSSEWSDFHNDYNYYVTNAAITSDDACSPRELQEGLSSMSLLDPYEADLIGRLNKSIANFQRKEIISLAKVMASRARARARARASMSS